MRRLVSARGLLRAAEIVCVIVGVTLTATWALTLLADRSAARAEIRRFEIAYPEVHALVDPAAPNFDLWSPQRVAAWNDAQRLTSPPPLGILRIERLKIEAALLEGTDEQTLNRAVGHIEGTPVPGADGNVGIAGHRDSFFRRLKDIALDDDIEILTRSGAIAYRVTRTDIVRPSDVWVLDPTPSATLTLVTCYPFRFVGSAPQRFVVRAARVRTSIGAERTQ